MGGKWRVFGENRNGKSDKRQSQIGSKRPTERGRSGGCQWQIACSLPQRIEST